MVPTCLGKGDASYVGRSRERGDTNGLAKEGISKPHLYVLYNCVVDYDIYTIVRD